MPRRRRHTVTFADGSQVVVMAYSLSGARTTAALRSMEGSPITRVEKGDYRMKLNPTGGWTLKHGALIVARDELDLGWPIHVTTSSREGETAGNYTLRWSSQAPRRALLPPCSFYHRIMLKSYLTPEEANESLWHELHHALQAERQGSMDRWLRWQGTQNRNWNYTDRPMEIEARQGAKNFLHLALTKPR